MYDKELRIQNPNGLNLISIRVNEIGSYFHFKQPLITAWYDCGGSVAKFLAVLPYSPEYRQEVRNRLMSNLNEDYTNRSQELKALIDPLLLALPPGEYSINFHNGSAGYYTSNTLLNGEYNYPWSLELGSATDVQKQKSIMQEYRQYVHEHKQPPVYAPGSLDGYATGSFYDGQSLAFVATQPASQINEERVKYFEEQITKGERPFAIIFNCYFDQLTKCEDGSWLDNSLPSDNYVIDGHHKLKAYHNLGLIPPVVEITHHPKTRDEIIFNVEDLMEALYPCDIEHMLKNWDNKEKYILSALENKDSNIHAFVKNGYIQNFHENGQLKHEGFYINDKIDGDGKWWYNNGQMEKIEFYKKGIPQGIWQIWYQSGEQHHTHAYNANGRLHGPNTWYYENGQKKRESIFNNGRLADSYSTAWYEDGIMQSEVKYVNDFATVTKSYDRRGKLISWEEWDPAQRKRIRRI